MPSGFLAGPNFQKRLEVRSIAADAAPRHPSAFRSPFLANALIPRVVFGSNVPECSVKDKAVSNTPSPANS